MAEVEQKQKPKASAVYPTQETENDLYLAREEELPTDPVASMTYSDPKELQTFVESVAKIGDEAVVNADQEKGVWVRVLDPADACMVVLEMPRTCFDRYEVHNEGRTGVDFNDLLKAAKRHKKQIPTLDIGTKGNAELHLLYEEKNREYSQPCFLPEAIREAPDNIPALDLTGPIELPVKEMYRAIKDAKEVSDHVELVLHGDTVSMKAEDDTRYTKTWNDDGWIGEERSLFSLEYLADMFHPRTKRFDTVSMYLGTDVPVVFEFVSDTGAAVRYLLAPRIESS